VELVVKGADKFNSTLGKATSSIAGFGKAAVKTAAVGVAAFGTAIAGVGAVSVKAAIDFESAFAGVIKTTDGLADSITGELTPAGEEMQQQFRDLAKEVPVAVEELLAIGEVGGQLGIASENLIGFTETIAAMGEATNLTTEEAAVGFAQLANVMGTSQDQIENMGSAIVDLGNNFATNERDILSFASRLAGAGEVAGLTEADVLGISAAFSSVGIQAQAGGTATSKAIIDMNTAAIEGGETMEIFAAVAGIEAENFGAAWEEDAGGVFGEFVKGLGLAGDDAIAILDALEIKDSQAVGKVRECIRGKHRAGRRSRSPLPHYCIPVQAVPEQDQGRRHHHRSSIVTHRQRPA
jgi:TP901 family phage tail tape measure protein